MVEPKRTAVVSANTGDHRLELELSEREVCAGQCCAISDQRVSHRARDQKDASLSRATRPVDVLDVAEADRNAFVLDDEVVVAARVQLGIPASLRGHANLFLVDHVAPNVWRVAPTSQKLEICLGHAPQLDIETTDDELTLGSH